VRFSWNQILEELKLWQQLKTGLPFCPPVFGLRPIFFGGILIKKGGGRIKVFLLYQSFLAFV